MSSSIWTTHWTTNGSTSKFHLKMFAPSYPFQHVFWQDIWRRLCSKFIMFWPKGKHLSSPVFCTTLHIQLGLPHPSIISIPRCVCTHPINLMGIHILHWIHDNKCIRTHDAIRDTFTSLHKMSISTWDEYNYMLFLQPHSTPLIDKLTLCLHNSRIYYFRCSSS